MKAARRYTAWFVGGLLLSLAATEARLRWMGYTPSVIDDRALWSYHRQSIEGADGKTLVLLGGSRMQLGVSLETLRSSGTRQRVAQLAVDGTFPLAALRDLAEDSQFSGLVLCSLLEPAFEPQNWDGQQPWVEYYRREFKVTTGLKRVFSGVLQQHFVLTNSRKPKYLTTAFDRSRSADYSGVDLAAHRQIRLAAGNRMFRAERCSSRAWLNRAATAESYVRAIQRRGGDVVFIRFPSSPPLYRLEQRRYPRREFWDRYARMTRATMLHFQDIPRWRQFDCPDFSHLDQTDKVAFTQTLVELLVARGIWDSAAHRPRLAQR